MPCRTRHQLGTSRPVVGSRRQSGARRTLVASAGTAMVGGARAGFGALVVSAAVVSAALLAGCGHSTPTAAPTTVASPQTTTPRASATTTTPTTPTPTSTTPPAPTTTWVATAPQPNAAAAAATLVSDWARTDRAQARLIATPQAIATIFAAPYPGAAAIDRGCTDNFPPIVCSYGPPGGGQPTDPLYEIYVTQSTSGWYVSSVVVEN